MPQHLDLLVFWEISLPNKREGVGESSGELAAMIAKDIYLTRMMNEQIYGISIHNNLLQYASYQDFGYPLHARMRMQ